MLDGVTSELGFLGQRRLAKSGIVCIRPALGTGSITVDIGDQLAPSWSAMLGETSDLFGVNPDQFCWLTRLSAVGAGMYMAG